jgi:hypothetical protein
MISVKNIIKDSTRETSHLLPIININNPLPASYHNHSDRMPLLKTVTLPDVPEAFSKKFN